MSPAATGCPGESVLLRHLDGELPDTTLRGVEAHLSACPECGAILERLRERDRAVRAWIERHDPEPPAREAYDFSAGTGDAEGDAAWPVREGWSRPRRWVAAAAVVVGLGVVVGPARGVVVDPVVAWVAGLLEASGSDRPPDGAVEPARAQAGGAVSAATSFRWSGPELVLGFQSPATRGRLTVEPAADSLVTLRGPAREVSLEVRPGAVRIDNALVPEGDYGLAVPSSLGRVRIRLPGRPDEVLEVGGLTAALSFSLHDPSPSRGGSR